jgi:hypothetical protein
MEHREEYRGYVLHIVKKDDKSPMEIWVCEMVYDDMEVLEDAIEKGHNYIDYLCGD